MRDETPVKLSCTPPHPRLPLRDTDIFLAPPALHIQATKEALTKDVLIGAQNIHSHEVRLSACVVSTSRN